jgi:hypothetical protein
MAKLFKSTEDERRDAMGRWTRAMERKGVTLHGTTGILGLSRDQVMAKLHDILDGASGGTPILGHHLARLAGTVSGFAIGSVGGVPPDVTQHVTHHAANSAEHVREALGQVIGKVLEHPRYKALAEKARLRDKHRVRKGLDATDAQELKNILVAAMADSRLPSQVNYSDAALTAVATGAYRHLSNRICALCDAT